MIVLALALVVLQVFGGCSLGGRLVLIVVPGCGSCGFGGLC